MSKSAKILISNMALPTTKIGSWTTRMSRFIDDNPLFFNYILSPSNSLSTSIYCKKGSFITWKKPFRNFQLLNKVASDYIKQIKRLSRNYDELTIVVMDDPHLVEAMSLIKNRLKSNVELIFSFHGFNLELDSKIMQSIDKILWLSQKASEHNKLNYDDNFPSSYVVGNAVDSDKFHPLNSDKFIEERSKRGYSQRDEILVWMANDRPKKGLHIFKLVVESLLEEHKNLKIIVIGTSQEINHSNVFCIGKIPNHEVATYLQIGNYYIFTTLYEEGFGLSVVEAYKCGNVVMASNKGAIPEVLNDLNHAYLVDEPENINSWVECFNLARTNSNFGKERISKRETDSIWNYNTWEEKFVDAIN
ncbi:glycosyltransferase [Winogradskyella flava]|uniref:Glycosyltransferase family 4 protein n=1 Tax=Winogradskyella flava TaxID=1884876 RepID=A0A842IVF6_9FLAO|nr:glycosyltransferase family 4 protein [Winogradskyella flava]